MKPKDKLNNNKDKTSSNVTVKKVVKLEDKPLITKRGSFADTSTVGSYAKNKTILSGEKPTPSNLSKYAIKALSSSSKTKEGYLRMQPSKTSESDELANYYGSGSPSNPKLARNPARLRKSDSGLSKSTLLRMKNK